MSRPVATRPRPDRALQQRAVLTRERILDAAVRSLVTVGYAGTSTLRIQHEAGVSRGRLLHHFPSRDELLVAAVQHLATTRFTALELEVSWPSDPSRRIGQAVGRMWSTYQQDYFWAACELWLAARHNAELRTALAPAEHALGVRIRSATDAMFGPRLAAHADYPRLREQLNTSMRGVALTYAFAAQDAARDPHLRGWRRTAREVLLADVAGRR